MNILDGPVKNFATVRIARADHGQLVLERDVLLDEQRNAGEPLPRRLQGGFVANHRLPFAVISHFSRLEDNRQSDS